MPRRPLGIKQHAQAREAVGIHQPTATSSASASSTSVGSMPTCSADLVEERRAVFADEVGHSLRLARSAVAGSDWPASIDQSGTLRLASNTMGVERTGAAPRAGASSARVPPRAARRVQMNRPARQCSSSHCGSYSVIARGNDFGLPGARRRFESLELREHRGQRIGALHPRIRQNALPFAQESQEIPGRDRLDFRAQPFHGVAMNAGQQPALAPFLALTASAVKRPRMANPSASSAPSARVDLRTRTAASDAAICAAVTGPSPRGGRARYRPSELIERCEQTPAVRPPPTAPRRPRRAQRTTRPSSDELLHQLRAMPHWRRRSSSVRKVSHSNASCNSSGVSASGHASARTRAMASGSSLPISAASRRVQPAAAHDGLGAPLLERRVIQVGVGPRIQGFERQRRGFGEIARDNADRAAFQPAQQSPRRHRCPWRLRGNRVWFVAPEGWSGISISPGRFSAQAT